MKEATLRATKITSNWEQRRHQTAVLILRSDMFANSVKPRVLTAHLRTLGYSVRSIESAALGRSGESGVARWLPSFSAHSLGLYARDGLQAVSRALLRCWDSRVTRYLNGMCLLWTMHCRGQFLARMLGGDVCDLLICESGFDQAVLLDTIGQLL